VFGDGKTAVRGGAGMLYDIATLGFSLFQTNLVPPFGAQSSTAFANNGPTTGPKYQLVLPLNNQFPPSTAPPALNGIQWNIQQPTLFQYNLAIDRQLPGNMSLTVAYAGSRGIHLIQTSEGNPTIPQGVISNGACVARPAGQGPSYSLSDCWLGNDPRINRAWGSDQLTDSGGDSWYNALQVLLNRRLTKGLQAQASYTYGRVIDDLQGQAGGETSTTPIYPEYVQDIALERGPATFDLTHNFRFTGIYKLPAYNSQKGLLGTTLSGWQITGVLTLESGYPFTPSLQTNFSKSGSSGGSNVVDHPNLAPGFTYYSIDHGVTPAPCTVATGSTTKIIPAGTALATQQLYFDPCGFQLPIAGSLGNVGRNSIYGPGLNNVDFSIIKDTPLKFREGAALEFRAEFFDIANHPNFAAPGITGSNVAGIALGTSNTPPLSAGVLSGTTSPGSASTTTAAREIQLALKLLF
jgi:hypothetical protein